MTQHPDNVKRGERAAISLRAHPMFSEEYTLDIRDLLADLRHHCDTHGIDFAEEDRIAHRNYISEVNDPTL